MKKPALIAISMVALISAVALLYHFAGSGSRPDNAISEQFDSAMASAAAGDLQGAIEGYETLVDEGQRSAAIYYNLGTVQQRAGDLGAAILNYERAATLEPGSADITANLKRARKDAAAIAPEPTRWEEFSKTFSANGWSNLAATALFAVAALAGFAAFGMFRPPRKLVALVTAIAFISICTSATVLSIQRKDEVGRGIVLKPGTPLRVSPFDGAKALTTLPAGKTIRFSDEQSHEGYKLATLPSGQSGWLQEGEAETIVTDP